MKTILHGPLMTCVHWLFAHRQKVAFDQVLILPQDQMTGQPLVKGFNDSLVAGFYHGAKAISNLKSDDFKDYQDYFMDLSSRLNQDYQTLTRTLVDRLKGLGVKVVVGHIKSKEDHQLVVSHLLKEETVDYDRWIDLTLPMEHKTYDSPLVYSLDELIHSEVILPKVAVLAASLRGVEMADMMANFGCQVALIYDQNIFSAIDHLMFRDGIKQVLEAKGVTLYDKRKVTEFHQKEKEVTLTLKSTSSLAFGLMDDLKDILLTVDMVLVDDGKAPCFNPDQGYTTLFTVPSYSYQAYQAPVEDPIIVRMNGSDLGYFLMQGQAQSGLEVAFDQNFNLVYGQALCPDSQVLLEGLGQVQTKDRTSCQGLDHQGLFQELLAQAWLTKLESDQQNHE